MNNNNQIKIEPSGIVRRVDDLGRIVLPKEIRRAMQLEDGDPVEFSMTNAGLLLRKYTTELYDFIQGLKKILDLIPWSVSVIVSNSTNTAIMASTYEKTYTVALPKNPDPISVGGDIVGHVFVTCKDEDSTIKDFVFELITEYYKTNYRQW